MTPLPHRQRGATLIVSLIMLLLITLLAVSSFTLGKGNLQIVGNMQQRQQAFAAAQGAVASLISSNQFSATPTDAFHNPCGGTVPCADGNVTVDCHGNKNTACVDSNGDGVTDVNVAVTAACAAIQPITTTASAWPVSSRPRAPPAPATTAPVAPTSSGRCRPPLPMR